MKIKILQLLILAILLAANAGLVALAQEGADTAPERAANSNQDETSSATGNQFFQPLPQTGTSKINLVQNLPKGDWWVALASVIRLVLQITGSLAFASFTYGGVLMIIARGDEGTYKKGKDIIFFSIFALVIIAASYAVVVGVTQLKFFQQ